MKFNKILLIVALVSINAMCQGLDVNELASRYGVQDGSIDVSTVNDIVMNIGNSTDNYNSSPELLALSGVLRAKLTATGDTTQAGLGGSANFGSLFPYYTTDVANQLKIVVDASSSPEQRKRAAQLIYISQWMGLVHEANNTPLSESIQHDINNARRSVDNAGILLYADQLDSASAGVYQTPSGAKRHLVELGATL